MNWVKIAKLKTHQLILYACTCLLWQAFRLPRVDHQLDILPISTVSYLAKINNYQSFPLLILMLDLYVGSEVLRVLLSMYMYICVENIVVFIICPMQYSLILLPAQGQHLR